FVEAELTALLQAAGGTLPVVKKDERGVFVMVETAGQHGHAAKPAPAKAAAAPTAVKSSAPDAAKAAPVAAPAKPVAPKGEAQPDRTLMKRYSYAGVVDTGPTPGETFAQKVERLKAVAAGAKKRADEGGVEPAAAAAAPISAPAMSGEQNASPVSETSATVGPVSAAAPPAAAGSPDRA